MKYFHHGKPLNNIDGHGVCVDSQIIESMDIGAAGMGKMPIFLRIYSALQQE